MARWLTIEWMKSQNNATGCAKKCPNLFLSDLCQIYNSLIIFGIQIAKTIKICKIYLLSTPIYVNALPYKTQMLQIVTLRGDYQYQIAYFW